MSQERWSAVDRYFSDHLVDTDSALEAALSASDAAGLPPINVAPNQGKLLSLFVLMTGARRVLEIGTLGGYSTLWLARELPSDGRLISLEVNPAFADVARSNVARANLDGIVDIRTGDAVDSLARLAEEQPEPFDLVFIDADKANNETYLERALALTKPGSVIICDNVVRGGAVTDATSSDPSVIGTRRFIERVAREPRLRATALQTVGSKGYDGFVLAVVTESR